MQENIFMMHLGLLENFKLGSPEGFELFQKKTLNSHCTEHHKLNCAGRRWNFETIDLRDMKTSLSGEKLNPRIHSHRIREERLNDNKYKVSVTENY